MPTHITWKKKDRKKQAGKRLKSEPLFVVGNKELPSASCPKHAATRVRHSVGKRWRAGLRFSNVHWAEEQQCLLTLPLLKQFWIGAGAYIRVAKAAISPPPSAMSSTVRIISSMSRTLRLLPGTMLLDIIERALENDASYSYPLILDNSNHFAHWQSPWKDSGKNKHIISGQQQFG